MVRIFTFVFVIFCYLNDRSQCKYNLISYILICLKKFKETWNILFQKTKEKTIFNKPKKKKTIFFKKKERGFFLFAFVYQTQQFRSSIFFICKMFASFSCLINYFGYRKHYIQVFAHV